MFYLDLQLRGLPKLQSGAFGSFWSRRKHDQEWRDKVQLLLPGRAPKQPLKRAEVICTRYSPREPDYDNLVASFKPLIDALIGTVIVDDSTDCLYRMYRWEKASRGNGKVSIGLRGEE